MERVPLVKGRAVTIPLYKVFKSRLATAIFVVTFANDLVYLIALPLGCHPQPGQVFNVLDDLLR